MICINFHHPIIIYKVIDTCIIRNWIGVLGERNSEGADFVLLGMMSVLTLDAFALQTGSTS